MTEDKIKYISFFRKEPQWLNRKSYNMLARETSRNSYPFGSRLVLGASANNISVGQKVDIKFKD